MKDSEKIKKIDMIIKKCIVEKYEYLDMAHTFSDCFDVLIHHKNFIDIKNNVKLICANNSNIEFVPSLSEFKSLIAIDLSYNNITILPELPSNIIELVATNNKIKTIEYYNKLKRLIVPYNCIKTIAKYPPTIERIEIANNPITGTIINLPKLYFIDIRDTKITKIQNIPNVTYIDASFSNISTIENIPKVETLICNNSQDIKILTDYPCLKELSIINTFIEIIPYYPKLEKLMLTNEKMILHNKYKITMIKKNRANNIEILF
jgi:Leucine-rich repeat (LRR) protein